MGLDARLRLARVYLCTDAREKQGDLEEFLTAAFAGGVDIVQIRQKGMAPKPSWRRWRSPVRPRRPTRASSASTTRPSSPGRFHADMLHLGQTDGESAPARRHLHQWAILGRSTHAPAQTDAAIKDPDVDYFCVGPVYATSTKPDYEPVGLDLVRYAAKVAPVGRIDAKPWFAIGGISTGQPRRGDRGRRPPGLRGPGDHRGVRSASRRRSTADPAAGRVEGRPDHGAVHLPGTVGSRPRAVSSPAKIIAVAISGLPSAQASRRTAASASEVRPARPSSVMSTSCRAFSARS